MSQITTHILDSTKGKPADGVTITLYQQQSDSWRQMALGTTNVDGRIPELLNADVTLERGIYKMKFDTKVYFDKLGLLTLYPYIEITFSVTGPEKYHIPLLLNAYGFTTYRGS